MDKVWTVYEMACFLSILVVDVPVIMLFFLFFRPLCSCSDKFSQSWCSFLVVSRPCALAATSSCSPGSDYSEGAADSVLRRR